MKKKKENSNIWPHTILTPPPPLSHPRIENPPPVDGSATKTTAKVAQGGVGSPWLAEIDEHHMALQGSNGVGSSWRWLRSRWSWGLEGSSFDSFNGGDLGVAEHGGKEDNENHREGSKEDLPSSSLLPPSVHRYNTTTDEACPLFLHPLRGGQRRGSWGWSCRVIRILRHVYSKP